jgi:hypothetical protein
MSGELIQHAIVTLAALGAAGIVVQRVFGFLRPAPRQNGCASCPSSRQACGTPSTQTSPPPAVIIDYSAVKRRRTHA